MFHVRHCFAALARRQGLADAAAQHKEQRCPLDNRDNQLTHEQRIIANGQYRYREKPVGNRQVLLAGIIECVAAHAKRKAENHPPVQEMAQFQAFPVRRQPQCAQNRGCKQQVIREQRPEVPRFHRGQPMDIAILRCFDESESGCNRRANHQTIQRVQFAP